jgi:hypothetical protein
MGRLTYTLFGQNILNLAKTLSGKYLVEEMSFHTFIESGILMKLKGIVCCLGKKHTMPSLRDTREV